MGHMLYFHHVIRVEILAWKFLTTYSVVIHQPVYDIPFDINYQSSYSFFLLHLAIVLSSQFLSRFALIPMPIYNSQIYPQFFFRFNAL